MRISDWSSDVCSSDLTGRSVTEQSMTFSPPRGRCTRWLLKAGTDVPDEVRNALIQSLYGTLPIYAGGVIKPIAVALLIWWRNPQRAFQIWLTLVLVCCLIWEEHPSVLQSLIGIPSSPV